MEAALIVLDGWGIRRHGPHAVDAPSGTEGGRDAIASASTPTFDSLLERGAVGRLRADGETVGLPPGQMGNSAVGHLTIGAGRVIEQEYARIDHSIADDSLGNNEVLRDLLDGCLETDGRLHLWGLLSDGGVHGDVDHLRAIIELAADVGVPVVTHVVTDGRDMAPTSAKRLLSDLERTIRSRDTGEIATVTGRYYAMDRDVNWERTYRAYEAMVHGRGRHVVSSARQAIEAAYRRGETDEFIQPTVIDEPPAIEDRDAIFLANFRADRSRQLTRMLADIDPVWSFETAPPSVDIATMSEYDRTFNLPVVFPPIEPEVTLGSVLADAGKTQLRIAESEKYPHVTYFINGGREVQFSGEHREIIPSPPVPTYDRQPEMSAPEVTDIALSVIADEDPDVLVLNYANPDMVGHTGDFDAVVDAIEAVDHELGNLLEGLPPCQVLIIADHGNAEDMGTPEDPHTAHTTNPVPCIYLDTDGNDGGYRIREGGTLADVTPTLLSCIGLEVPEAMTGSSLLD